MTPAQHLPGEVRLHQDSRCLGRDSAAAGPCSHTVPQLLGPQCPHPTACFLFRPFSAGSSGMPCGFAAHNFILTMLYLFRKLAFISLVFQEFYMAIIFINDEVNLIIVWHNHSVSSKHCGAALNVWLPRFSTPGSDAEWYVTVTLICSNSFQPPRNTSKCSASVPSVSFISHSAPVV